MCHADPGVAIHFVNVIRSCCSNVSYCRMCAMFYRIIQNSVKFYHGKYLEKGCHRTIDVYSCCRNHDYLLIVVMKQVKLYTDWFGCLIDTLKQKGQTCLH